MQGVLTYNYSASRSLKHQIISKCQKKKKKINTTKITDKIAKLPKRNSTKQSSEIQIMPDFFLEKMLIT